VCSSDLEQIASHKHKYIRDIFCSTTSLGKPQKVQNPSNNKKHNQEAFK